MVAADTAVTFQGPHSDTEVFPKGKCFCRLRRTHTHTHIHAHAAVLAQVEHQTAPASGCHAECTQDLDTADSPLKESREE